LDFNILKEVKKTLACKGLKTLIAIDVTICTYRTDIFKTEQISWCLTTMGGEVNFTVSRVGAERFLKHSLIDLCSRSANLFTWLTYPPIFDAFHLIKKVWKHLCALLKLLPSIIRRRSLLPESIIH